jgi:transcriptional regulator with XRE-family HTH domain
MRSIARNVALEMALQQRAMGRRIAQLRERGHLTQEAAAERAGVTLRAYQKWEAGGGIQYANLQKLATALKASVEEITGEAETPSPFRVGEQIDDMAAEFRRYVKELQAGIAENNRLLEAAQSEREAIRDLLKIQESILKDMRQVADEFPAKAEMDALRVELARIEERDRAAEAERRASSEAADRARRRGA